MDPPGGLKGPRGVQKFPKFSKFFFKMLQLQGLVSYELVSYKEKQAGLKVDQHKIKRKEEKKKEQAS